jgi:hypothetical protein
VFEEPGEAKIGYIRLAGAVENDVGGFEVTMEDAAGMGVGHGLADLEKQAD